jgi:hypothetical protein
VRPWFSANLRANESLSREINVRRAPRFGRPFRAFGAALALVAALNSGSAAATPPWITVSDVTVKEVNTGSTVLAKFKVSISRSANSTIHFATSDGTAAAGSDYVAKSVNVSFVRGGATTKKVAVTITGDNVDEVDETFGVTVTAVKNAVIVDGSAIGTITDNDGPTISVADVVGNSNPPYNEGGTGETNRYVRFKVQLSAASPQQVTVNAATTLDASGAHPASSSDFAALPTTALTFAPGETSKNVDVHVTGDLTVEGDETFLFNLSSPTRATIADSQAVGTIDDDDCTGSNPGAASAYDFGSMQGDAAGSTQTFSRTGAIDCSGEYDWYKFTLTDLLAACTLYNSRYITVKIVFHDGGWLQAGTGSGANQFLVSFFKTNGTVGVANLGPSAWPHSFYLWRTDYCSGVDDSITVWMRVALDNTGSRTYWFDLYPSSGRPTDGSLEFSLD